MGLAWKDILCINIPANTSGETKQEDAISGNRSKPRNQIHENVKDHNLRNNAAVLPYQSGYRDLQNNKGHRNQIIIQQTNVILQQMQHSMITQIFLMTYYKSEEIRCSVCKCYSKDFKYLQDNKKNESKIAID